MKIWNPNRISIVKPVIIISQKWSIRIPKSYPYILTQNRNIYKYVGVSMTMVSVKKKIMKNNTYYYLEHSYRLDGKVMKKELYLGRKVPKDIEYEKRVLLAQIDTERWFNQFDIIKENYIEEVKRTPPSAKEKVLDDFAIRFTYNTNRIEGSTLTLTETADLLEKGITPSRRPLVDIKETETHKIVFQKMLYNEKDLSLKAILAWHKELFEGTKGDIAGEVRNHRVAITRSEFTPPDPRELGILLREFFKWYHKNKNKIHPVELAALVHLKFVTIHPFSDGNGRISRLIMNFVLNKNSFPMLIVQYTKRKSYYRALERSQVKKDDRIFVQWSFKRYLKEYIEYLNEE